jgi:hypothetical protein
MALSAHAPSCVGIFISHRHQDRHIADVLRDELAALSQDLVQVFFSAEMQGGEPYRQWIRSSIKQSDVLLLLLTEAGPLTQWCSYEVGRFLQKCEERGDELKNRFVCLKNVYLNAPPGPIEEFQAVEGNADALYQFFVDLLEKGTYTGGRPIIAPYNGFYAKARESAATLARAMSPVISKVHFHGRLVVEFHDGQHRHEDPRIVFADRDFADIASKLGCTADANTLSELRAATADTPAAIWLEELDEFISKDATRRSEPRLPVLTTFQDSNGVKYIPLISGMQKINDEPQTIEILFVVMPDALRDVIELEKRDPLAMRQYEIIKLLRMGRRFRYDIVDPFLHDIEQVRIDEAKGEFDEDYFQRKCQKYLSRLQRLLQEGNENRYRTYSFTSDILDLPNEEYLEELYFDYSLVKFRDAIEKLDLKEMRRSLKAFRTHHKKFMLTAAEAYLRKLDEMKPRDVTRADVIAAAFATSKATERGLRSLLLTYQGNPLQLDTQSSPLVIGRDEGCGLVVAGPLVSRRHAVVEATGGKFSLTDQSANGTFVIAADGQTFFLKREMVTLPGSGTIVLGEKPGANAAATVAFSHQIL